MIRVAVVDDHPHVAISLRSIFNGIPDISLIAESRSGSEIMNLITQFKPHVLLLDIFIETDFDALSTVKKLRRIHPELKICLLSAFLEPLQIRDFLQAGVYGYILKDDDYISKIDTIIRDLAVGEIYLSPQAYESLAIVTRTETSQILLTDREKEILRFANRGFPNPHIAQLLHISPGTVRNHLSSIYRKMNVHSRHEALQFAKENNLIK
jgi:DNA-binding NarL/FixJ family response regulator